VIIDIRNNNGGFINPYVIDILARRGYLTMKERGLWNVPARSALGQRALEKPTVLITNQHSLSDAEDLTEGYRSLKLGKVIGEPTAGLDNLHLERPALRRNDGSIAATTHFGKRRQGHGA
jgi:C-terminal processing protease CtpA/Prc